MTPPDPDLLADLDAGLLDPARAREVRSTALADPRAAAVLDALRTTRADLAALPAPAAPPAAVQRWLTALAADRTSSGAAIPGQAGNDAMSRPARDPAARHSGPPRPTTSAPEALSAPESPGRRARRPSAPGPSAPGPSAPGPSAPGPSAPGPSAPGPSAPGPPAPGPPAPGPAAPTSRTPRSGGPDTRTPDPAALTAGRAASGSVTSRSAAPRSAAPRSAAPTVPTAGAAARGPVERGTAIGMTGEPAAGRRGPADRPPSEPGQPAGRRAPASRGFRRSRSPRVIRRRIAVTSLVGAAALVVGVVVALVGDRGRAVDVTRVELAAVARSTVGVSELGPYTDLARREACLVTTGHSEATVVGGRPVRFDGSPGVLLVLSTGVLGRFRVLVVDDSCRTLADEVIGR